MLKLWNTLLLDNLMLAPLHVTTIHQTHTTRTAGGSFMDHAVDDVNANANVLVMHYACVLCQCAGHANATLRCNAKA